MQISNGDYVLYFDNFNDTLVVCRIVPGATKTQLRAITMAQADSTELSTPDFYNNIDEPAKADTTDWAQNLVLAKSESFEDIAESFNIARAKLFPKPGDIPDVYKDVTTANFNEELEPQNEDEDEIDFDVRLNVLLRLR